MPGGAAAHGILTFDGVEVAIEIPKKPLAAPATLGGAAIGVFQPGESTREVISRTADAARIWAACIEEWKLLTVAALIGLSREVLSMAAAYACERIAFGQPIGANQGIAYPLANDVIDADGAAMLLWWTLRAIADGRQDAPATVSMLYWWTTRTATNSVAHSLHTFGGYGLTNEYDLQLYHRRAKAWALVLGDPQSELVRGGRRLLLGERAALPDPGLVEVNFEPPTGGQDSPPRRRRCSTASSIRKSTSSANITSRRTIGRYTARSAKPGCCFRIGRKNGVVAARMRIRPAPASWFGGRGLCGSAARRHGNGRSYCAEIRQAGASGRGADPIRIR